LLLHYNLEPYKQLAMGISGVGLIDDAANAVAVDSGGTATDYDAVGRVYGRPWTTTAQPVAARA